MLVKTTQYIRAFFRLLGIVFVTLHYLFKGLWILKYYRNKEEARLKVVQDWATSCLWVLNVKLEKDIQENGLEKGLILSNHRSYLDIFILLSMYPSSIVAKEEIGSWPGIRKALKLGDIILVRRGRMDSMIQTMREIRDRMFQHKSVILFPEGGIHKSHLPVKFKQGSFLIAEKLGCSVTPVALWYEDKNDAWVGKIPFVIHFFKQMGKRQTFVKVKVMEAILSNDARAACDITYKKIYEAVKSYDKLAA